MSIDQDELLAAAPVGTNLVTMVTSVPTGQPRVIISQHTEDGDGEWQPTGMPLEIPMTEVSELANMLMTAKIASDVEVKS